MNIIQKKKKVYWLGFDYNKTPMKFKKGFENKEWLPYHKISAHYKFAFQYMFDTLNFEKIIVLEDDMEISPDFYNYFDKIGELLSIDKTIFCISAWNDNGQRQYVYDSKQLYRTDIFPGLGWMLTKDIWDEFKNIWPLAFWDDWLREIKQRKNRTCIRPEINRVYTFGEQGSSKGQFYNKYLKSILLNDDDIDWSKQDTTYILSNNYDNYILNLIKLCTKITITQLINIKQQTLPLEYCIEYNDLNQLTLYYKKIGLMTDHKDGLPRASYKGIVIIRYKHHKILFLPQILNLGKS